MNTCSGRAFSSWSTTMLPPSLNRQPSFSTPSQPPPPAFLCSSKSTQSRSLARRPFYNPLGRLWIETDQCPPPPSQEVRFLCVVKKSGVDRYFDLLKVMQKAGYESSYKRCTDDKVDGCAVFWKADKQTSRAESRRILIGNIHVIFRPSRGDVKLSQIRYLSSRAQTLSEKWGNIPVILTGDFNSTPQLNIKLHDRKNLSGQRNFHPTQVFATNREMGSPLMLMDRCLDNTWTDDEVTAATGHSNRDFVKHPLKLSSSYATVQDEPTKF
ncbi:Carbon catabolite repressor protein 4 homolog 3 [Linum perenne]